MNQHHTPLLNYGFSLAKYLLEDQGEFFPFAVYIDEAGNPKQHLAHFGDDFPLSTEHIKQLEADLMNKPGDHQAKYFTIIYDTLLTNASYQEQNTMVAKYYKPEDKEFGYYYMPYVTENKEVRFLEGWK